MRNRIVLLVVIGVALAAAWVVVMPSVGSGTTADRLAMLGLILAVVAMIAALNLPRVRALVETRKRLVSGIGAAAFAAAVLVLIGGVQFGWSTGATGSAAGALMVLGLCLVMLPGNAARMRQTMAAAKALPPVAEGRPAPDFSGRRAAAQAYGLVFNRPLEWLMVAGPWMIVAVGGAPLLGLFRGKISITVALLAILAWAVVNWLGMVLAAFFWQRRVQGVSGGSPVMTALGYGARCLLFTLVALTVGRVVSDQARNFGLAGEAVQAVSLALGLLMLLYLGLLGLVLPARAAGDGRVGGGVAMIHARRLKGYLPGFMLATAPYLLVDASLDQAAVAANLAPTGPAAMGLWILRCLALGVWTCVGAGYLSLAYRAIEPSLAAPKA
jgi:hypothetical protein